MSLVQQRNQALEHHAIEGDRLGINAVLGITNSLAGKGWTYIDSANFNGVPGELRFDKGNEGRRRLRVVALPWRQWQTILMPVEDLNAIVVGGI